MLNAMLRGHLNKFKSPVADDMMRNLYVDNIISGSDSEEQAIQYYVEARSIMAKAKFNLRSWASNSNAVQRLAIADNVIDKDSNANILGLKWNTSTDTLTFTSKEILSTDKSVVSKREVLQCSSRLYDPLGFLAPVTIQAKLFMQELWQLKLSWDEPLSEALSNRWHKTAQEIQNGTKMVFPRRYFISTSTTKSLLLHVFAAASIRAYGAVAYLCHNNHSSLAIARTRVAPLKTKTLPRLELMAAVVAARLAMFVVSSLSPINEDISIHLWSDSQIVLYWLHSHKSLKPFVASRVQEINELFTPTAWRYCPTADNPADLLTRGINAASLDSSVLWKHGPAWLTTMDQWPVWNHTEVLHIHSQEDIIDSETQETATGIEQNRETVGLHCIITISNHSSLDKLLGVTAYILRFIRNTKQSTSTSTGPLSVQELHKAKLAWIRNCQQQIFSKEHHNITSKVSNRLLLVRQLRLFLDNSQFIRCGGRIHNAPVSELMKFPYLLPKNHPFTTLIIRDCHIKQGHAGTNSTITAIRPNLLDTGCKTICKEGNTTVCNLQEMLRNTI